MALRRSGVRIPLGPLVFAPGQEWLYPRFRVERRPALINLTTKRISGVVSHPSASREGEVEARQGAHGALRLNSPDASRLVRPW